ncbi:MAG: hypothetical protein WA858_00995, partial [Xanthobacteraceae bacterium]
YYPDGAVLFLGTLFAPTKDRDAPGQGFTHKVGDIVTVAAPELGSLVNRMRHCQDCEPWRFGTSHLMRNLAHRGVLSEDRCVGAPSSAGTQDEASWFCGSFDRSKCDIQDQSAFLCSRRCGFIRTRSAPPLVA